jgi:hypothetical protein
MNADPNPYPDPDKTARHEPYPVFVLLLSFGTNILAKFFVNFVLHEGKRTETGYSFMSRFLVRVRARIRVSIHKQRHMGRHVEQKLSSMPSSSLSCSNSLDTWFSCYQCSYTLLLPYDQQTFQGIKNRNLRDRSLFMVGGSAEEKRVG